MIKFFRHIRQNLLIENKTGKYLKYAIGEIVLVVIGILIALQINNWNENRKEQQTLNNIYVLVAEDLKSDIDEVTNVINDEKPREQIIDKILDGNMTEEEFKNCKICMSLINGYPDWAVDQRGFNLLNNYYNNSNLKENSLQLMITQFYTKYLVEFSGDDLLRSHNLEKNIFDWETKEPWYASFVTERDYSGYIDYAMKSQDFKNRIATYYLLHFDIYTPLLENFIKDANMIIQLINNKIKVND